MGLLISVLYTQVSVTEEKPVFVSANCQAGNIHQQIPPIMAQQIFLRRIAESIRRGIKLLQEGHFSLFWNEFRKRLYSRSQSFGLRRDLDEIFQPPDAKIDISIRPLQKGDLDFLMENGKLAQSKPRLAAYQQSMVRAEIPTCYVAVTEDDKPCYMQWLIGPKENPLIQDHFGKLFPPLDDNQALLEAAFMQRSFLGLNIMPAAMACIAEKGKELGVRWTLTFVGCDNVPALKGCRRAGFTPYILRKEQWFFFYQFISFSAIPADLLERYEQATGDQHKRPTKNWHSPEP